MKIVCLFGLLLLALSCMLLSLAIGSVELSLAQVWHALWSSSPSLERTIVVQIRLPRTENAFLVGGLLALSGVLLQALLRNPLAEPYILGVSGGASVGALAAILLGVSSFMLSLMAFSGALLSMALVFSIVLFSHKVTSAHILLTGVVIATGWGAVVNVLLVIGPGQEVKAMLFWLMGDLSHATSQTAGVVCLTLGLLSAFALSRPLNALLQGNIAAQALGVNVFRVQIVVYFLASFLTAVAVTMAGGIGFIGLVAPHMMRLVIGTDHRFLLPAATLFGGCLLVISDMLARTIVAPQQLPPGVVTALVGAPMFLYLLMRSARL